MIGRTLGRYKIIEHLGTGGEGSVWKAEHQLLREPRALKFLPESLSIQPAARRRFLNAARAVCRLSHPHVAAAHDADEIDGQVFIAYEFVEGESLAQRLKRGPLQMAEAVRLTREAAEGLAHSHSRGVLHRDVSSANLMVTREGHVKIVDFGLARVEEFSRATTSDALMGTAAYIAPEVIRNQRWDERCDLYALGVVLYEMLTGKRPFDGPLESQLYQKLHDVPEAPSAHRPAVPQRLDRIVLDALERNPAHRPQTGELLAAQLAELAASATLPAETDEDIELRPVAPTPSSSWWNRFTRRTRHALRSARGRRSLAGTLIAVGAILATAIVLMLATSTPAIRSIAVLPLVNLSADPEASNHLARGIGGDIATRLGKLPELKMLSWETTRRFQPDSALGLQPIWKGLRKVDAVVTGTLQDEGENLQVRMALVDRTGFERWSEAFNVTFEEMFKIHDGVAIGVAEVIKGRVTVTEQQQLTLHPAASVEAYDSYLLASDLYRGGGDRESADLAMETYQSAVQLDPNLADAYVGMGAILSDRYFRGWQSGVETLAEAEAYFQKALKIRPRMGTAERGLIHVHWMNGESEKLLRVGQEAATRGWDEVEALQVRAEALLLGGFPDRAVPVFERVIELEPAHLAAHWYRVIALSWVDRHHEALVAGENMILAFGEDPEALYWMGTSCFELDSLEAARSYFERANDLYDEDPTFYNFINSGHVYRELGMVDRANGIWSEGLERLAAVMHESPGNNRMRLYRAVLSASIRDTVAFRDDAMILFKSVRSGGQGLGEFASLAVPFLYLGMEEDAEAVIELSESSMAHQDFRMMARSFLGPDWRRRPGVDRSLKSLEERQRKWRALY